MYLNWSLVRQLKLDKLKNFISAFSYIYTGFPIVCAHRNEGDPLQPHLHEVVLTGKIIRVGRMRKVGWMGRCEECGVEYRQDSGMERGK